MTVTRTAPILVVAQKVDAVQDENAISFFDYIKTKHPEFKGNIYYNVGEIYVKGETCIQKTTDVIKIMKDSFEKDPKGFEMLLMSGMKKYGEKTDISKRDIKANTNYFMASVSDFEEHKNLFLLQSLGAITNLNKLIQENLELKELFGKVGK